MSLKNRAKVHASHLQSNLGSVVHHVRSKSFEATAQTATHIVLAGVRLREKVRQHLTSVEFEAKLDQLMSRQVARIERPEMIDPVGDAQHLNQQISLIKRLEKAKVAGEIESRIQRKLQLLVSLYATDIFETARKGALYGGIFGPTIAVRFALVAGGVKLTLICAGVVSVFLIEPSGRWLQLEQPAEL